MDTVGRFMQLFDGRHDAWGHVEGRCVKEPWDWNLMYGHLYEEGKSLGVYPLVGGYVKWGCVDIDRGMDMIALAKNLAKACKALGMVPWIERTKGKGYHVWVFVSDWWPAEQMRNALLVACQIAGVPPTEVNPKQVSGTEYGNYVNLPYAKTWADLSKRVVLLDGTEDHWNVEAWAQAAHANRTHPDAIEAASNLYVPPPPPKAVQIERYEGGMDEAVRKLNGLAFTIFNEGPLEGRDRSMTLQRLVHLSRESGLTPGEALEILVDADRRWGKFSERADGHAQMQKMIERAYG